MDNDYRSRQSHLTELLAFRTDISFPDLVPLIVDSLLSHEVLSCHTLAAKLWMSLCHQNIFFLFCHGNMERYILVSVIMFVLGLKEKNYKLRVSKGCDSTPPFQPSWQRAPFGSLRRAFWVLFRWGIWVSEPTKFFSRSIFLTVLFRHMSVSRWAGFAL